MKHLAVFFDDSVCGLKNVNKRELTYQLSSVTCPACMEASRLEAIENQKALDKLPHCPHCGEIAKTITLTFSVTKVFTLDVMTERDWETQTIKPLIYGTESDTLDNEFQFENMWQVDCENNHTWFTRKIEPIEDGAQWFVKDGETDEVNQEDSERICPVCGNDRSEHDWEVHTAELKSNG